MNFYFVPRFCVLSHRVFVKFSQSGVKSAMMSHFQHSTAPSSEQ
uniref:Uncharacterized protein n=1 Tax=Anguilla anguilla TaxID=7936 RepID=A0A0E9Q1T1_ANGAN